MFFKCLDKNESQKLFHKLALRLHPDHGGSNELMILLQEAYQERIRVIEMIEESREHEKQNKTYENVYEKIYLRDERINVMHEIMDYLQKKPDIKIEFAISVHKFLKDNGYVTSGQYNTLVKIYYQFEMDKK